MDLSRIATISDSNIDRIIDENLYRGIGHPEDGLVEVQCMNKDITVRFDFVQETADIDGLNFCRIIAIDSMAPKRMMTRIIEATC